MHNCQCEQIEQEENEPSMAMLAPAERKVGGFSRFNCTTKAKPAWIYEIYFEFCDGC